jgi:hypothetical protein
MSVLAMDGLCVVLRVLPAWSVMHGALDRRASSVVEVVFISVTCVVVRLSLVARCSFARAWCVSGVCMLYPSSIILPSERTMCSLGWLLVCFRSLVGVEIEREREREIWVGTLN